ncbi:conserved hypothetical protein [Neospora caninum Liverpool]|uniref:Uncharacterized protein n=1 Tax=Neospora caninum (strain Liverpool) TaxID=572307 RepID=F0VCR1_NEOCL|nr:conserved hypothetical protein [Neospora caninum Liverpool]CBZ51426.1 conserved hypothetical protein [Neospora caninum Liverpool]CEL65374.1 TPA: hypothetical protein BN1204_012240 [Neospora caninum Liverpool]|eukprot:XP_003881459.1 conserved hypothetical protein [Neospora caninum Liverpool]
MTPPAVMGQKKSPSSSVEKPFEGDCEGSIPSAGAHGSFVTVWRQAVERGGALRPSSGCLRPSPDGRYLACSTGGTSLCILDAVAVTDPARRLPFSGHGSAVVSVLRPLHHPPPPSNPPNVACSTSPSSSCCHGKARAAAPETDASSSAGVVSTSRSRGHRGATAEVFRMLRGASEDPGNRRFRSYCWSPPLLSRYNPRPEQPHLDLSACLLCTATRDGSIALWGVPEGRSPIPRSLALLSDLSEIWNASLRRAAEPTRAAQSGGGRGQPEPSAEGSILNVKNASRSQPLCYWWTVCAEAEASTGDAGEENPVGCGAVDLCGEAAAAGGHATADERVRRHEPGRVPSRADGGARGEPACGATPQHEGGSAPSPRMPVFGEGGVFVLGACANLVRILAWKEPLVAFSSSAALPVLLRLGRKSRCARLSLADSSLEQKRSESARSESAPHAEASGSQADDAVRARCCRASERENGSPHRSARSEPERSGSSAFAGDAGVERDAAGSSQPKGDLQVEAETVRGCICAVAGPHAISVFWLSNRRTALEFCADREADLQRRANEDSLDSAHPTRGVWNRPEGPQEGMERQQATADAVGCVQRTLRRDGGCSLAQTGHEARASAAMSEDCPTPAANMKAGKRRKVSQRGSGGRTSGTGGPWRAAAEQTDEEGEDGQEGQEGGGTSPAVGVQGGKERAGVASLTEGGGSRRDPREKKDRRGKRGASLEPVDEREKADAENADQIRRASSKATASAPPDAKAKRPVRACRSRATFRVVDSDDASSDSGNSDEAREDALGGPRSAARRKGSEGVKRPTRKGRSKAEERSQVRGPARKRKRKMSSDDDLYHAESSPESSSDEDDLEEESLDDGSDVGQEDSDEEDRGRSARKNGRESVKGRKTSAHKESKAAARTKGFAESHHPTQRNLAGSESPQPRTWRQLASAAQHAEAQRLLSAAVTSAPQQEGTRRGRNEETDAREPFALLVQVLLMPGSSKNSKDSPLSWEPNWRQAISDIALTPLTAESTSLLHRNRSTPEEETVESVETVFHFQVLATTCNGSLLAFPCGLVVRSRESRLAGSVPRDDAVIQIVRCTAAPPQLLLSSLGVPAVHLHVQPFLPFFGRGTSRFAGSQLARASHPTPSRGAAFGKAADNEQGRRMPRRAVVGDGTHAREVTLGAAPWLWAVCACGELVRAVVFDGHRWMGAPQNGWPKRSTHLRAGRFEDQTNAGKPCLDAHSPSGRPDGFSIPPAREANGTFLPVQRAGEVSRRGLPAKPSDRGGVPVVTSFVSLVPLNHVPANVWDAVSPFLPALQCRTAPNFSPVERNAWLPQASLLAVDSSGVTVTFVLGSLSRGPHTSPPGSHRGHAPAVDLCWTLVRLTQSTGSVAETAGEGSLLHPLACGARRPRHKLAETHTLGDEDRCGSRPCGLESRVGAAGSAEQTPSIAAVYAAAAREAGFRVDADSPPGTSDEETHVRRELRGSRNERGSLREEAGARERNGGPYGGGEPTVFDDGKNLGVLLSEMRGRSAHQLQVMQQLGKLRPRSMQGQDQRLHRSGGASCGRSTVLGLTVSSSGAVLFSLTLHQQVYVHVAVAPMAVSATELLLTAWQRHCQQARAALFALLLQFPLKSSVLPEIAVKTVPGPCEARHTVPGSEQRNAPPSPEACSDGGNGDGAPCCFGGTQVAFDGADTQSSFPSGSRGAALPPSLPRASLEFVDSVSLWELAFFLHGPTQPAWSAMSSLASDPRPAAAPKRRQGQQSSGVASRLTWEDAELEEELSTDLLHDRESVDGFSGDEESLGRCVYRSSNGLASEGGEWAFGNWATEWTGKLGAEATGRADISPRFSHQCDGPGGGWDGRDLMQRWLCQRTTGLRMLEDGSVSWGASVKPEDVPSVAADLLRTAFLQALSQCSSDGLASAACLDEATGSVDDLVERQPNSAQRETAAAAVHGVDDCSFARCDDACAVRSSLSQEASEENSKCSLPPPEVDMRGRVLLGALLLAADSMADTFSFQRRLLTIVQRAGLAALAAPSSTGAERLAPLTCLLRHLRQGVDGLKLHSSGSFTVASAHDTSAASQAGRGEESASRGRDRETPPRPDSGAATTAVGELGCEAQESYSEKHQQCVHNCQVRRWAGLLWHWERVMDLASAWLSTVAATGGGQSGRATLRCEANAPTGDPFDASTGSAHHVAESHMRAVDRVFLLQRLAAVSSLCQPPPVCHPFSSRGAEHVARMHRGRYTPSISPTLVESPQAGSPSRDLGMAKTIVPSHASSSSTAKTAARRAAAGETVGMVERRKAAFDLPRKLRGALVDVLNHFWKCSSSKKETCSRDSHEGNPLSGSQQLSSKCLRGQRGAYSGAFRITLQFPDLFQVPRLEDNASGGGPSAPDWPRREKPSVVGEREKTFAHGLPGISPGVDGLQTSGEIDSEVNIENVEEGTASVKALYLCLICGTQAELVLFRRTEDNARRHEPDLLSPGPPGQNANRREGWVGADGCLATSCGTPPARDAADAGRQGKLRGVQEASRQAIWLQIGSALSGGGAAFSCPLCRGDLCRAD